MTKGIKLSELEKSEITALKRVGKSQKFRRPSNTVKSLSAITLKVQISMEQGNRLAGRNTIPIIHEKNCS